MCGIAGIITFTREAESYLQKIDEATDCLARRGPDDRGTYLTDNLALGHRRLSIIDVSHAAAQPMSDAGKRYHIIFNGEFFNYGVHRKLLEKEGVVFQTHSDTEVLLNLYIKEGPLCLDKVNGFFSLAIYDAVEKTLFIARDRMGVKPLVYFYDDEKFFFASEMKALFAMGMPKEINHDALHVYFQLNYLPPETSVLKHVKKLRPGSYLLISLKERKIPQEISYYDIPYFKPGSHSNTSYHDACTHFSFLLEESVQRRLVSDVPLGAFLSGGLDSSVIVALASRHVKNLNTFSIGFKDSPHFDETNYAESVASKFKTNHQSFQLSTDDLLNHLFQMLDYIDEPFADSSALNVYILCKETRRKVTVALSGDGADELFGGYQKHRAEWLLRHHPANTFLLKSAAPLLTHLKGSRNGRMANKLRQLQRFANGASLNASDRYWLWCSLASRPETDALLLSPAGKDYQFTHHQYTQHIDQKDINSVLNADMKLVLAGDMLVKVDLMSMANSLEVRNPFIDKEVVNYAFTLSGEYKIDRHTQKKIVRDAFKKIIPPEIVNRSKKGFEVPLLSWFNNELKSVITEKLLNEEFIREQGLFNVQEVQRMKTKLFSRHPGEMAGRIWALLVFQHWYKKYFAN